MVLNVMKSFALSLFDVCKDTKNFKSKKCSLVVFTVCLKKEFDVWFQETQGSRKVPKGEELYEYMTKKFGQCKTTGWHGVAIIYPDEEADTLAEL